MRRIVWRAALFAAMLSAGIGMAGAETAANGKSVAAEAARIDFSAGEVSEHTRSEKRTDGAENEKESIPPLVILPAEAEAEPEAEENAAIEEALILRAERIDDCLITYYCPCVRCNGSNAGRTATGTYMIPGATAAVDPAVIPLGSEVMLDFGDGELQYYRAADTGVRGNHIDLLLADHAEALERGAARATVWWIGPAEGAS